MKFWEKKINNSFLNLKDIQVHNCEGKIKFIIMKIGLYHLRFIQKQKNVVIIHVLNTKVVVKSVPIVEPL